MRTVLIAEDEKLIRKGLETMVRRAPVPVDEVLSAKDGEEALEILRSRPVDVLITDIRMPRMDGIALTEQAAALPNPPLVLVISGYDDFNYAVSMLRQGVHDYLLKPVERERLFDVLGKLEEKLKERRREEQIISGQYLHAVRLIILEKDEGGETYRKLVEQYASDFIQTDYLACCAREPACGIIAGKGRNTWAAVPERPPVALPPTGKRFHRMIAAQTDVKRTL